MRTPLRTAAFSARTLVRMHSCGPGALRYRTASARLRLGKMRLDDLSTVRRALGRAESHNGVESIMLIDSFACHSLRTLHSNA